MQEFNKGDIVVHKTGIELEVKSSNSYVSTCIYVNEEDYIHSKCLGIKSVVKVCICLNENLTLKVRDSLSFSQNQLKLF